MTYVVVGRDPRDVLVSWEHHVANMDLERFVAARADAVGLDDLAELEPLVPPMDDPRERFLDFVDNDSANATVAMSLQAVLHHLATARDERHTHNVVMFHFADYHADLVGEMEQLAAVLGIETSRDRLAAMAVEAGLERMRAPASTVVPVSSREIWKDAAAFFRRGASGEWVERLRDGDADRYRARVTELVDADLAAWAHGGWLGSGLERA